jgi:hypothetical protein
MPNKHNPDIAGIRSDQSASPFHAVLLQFVILYGLTISAQLVSLAYGRIDGQQSFSSILLPSVMFLSVVTTPSILLGIGLGRQIRLGGLTLTELLSGEPGRFRKAGNDAGLACVLGFALGGLLLLIRQLSAPYLPPEIPAYGHRGILGGLAVSLGAAVAEEVWFRFGLMTLLVWSVMRLLKVRKARSTVVWPIIVFSSVAFGMAHLPQLISYGAGSPFAIGGTVVGNTAVGILYGWCYWKRGLVTAMVAHFSVDIVIHVLPALA